MNPKTKLTNTLKELEIFVEKGDVNKLKESIYWFHKDLDHNIQELNKLYSSGNQCAAQAALILAACRSNQADILYYLLYETDILNHFPGADFDDKGVITQRTEAFKLALERDNFPMVDMLYDHWSGNLHWIGHDINKLTTLGKMLQEAHKVCAVENQQLLIDINSLIKFNAFQQKLYSSISNITTDKTADMLIEVLRIYDEYSDIDKVRIPHEEKEIEQELRSHLEDKSCEYFRMHAYIKYTVYFRKLDFNVALLILDNWFVLRRQFRDRFNQPKEYFTNNLTVKSSYEKAVSLYKEIECTLYHYIYHTWDDWRQYLPRNRQVTVEENHTGIHNGDILKTLKIKYDKHTLFNGPVLFLERKSFSDRVKELKPLLEEHIIGRDPAKNWMKNYKIKKPRDIYILLDDNYLTPLSPTDTNTYMRDFYSLSKIVYYIKAIENTNDKDVLIIERVLQVTGEMLKSTKKCKHLSDFAQSLLQIAISVDTVKHISNIRYYLSHADKGELSTRTKIAKTSKLFHAIRQDLINIEQMITPVLDIYKIILDKSFLERGLTLLDKQIQNLPDQVSQHVGKIDDYYKTNGSKLIDSNESKPLIQELSVATGITIQLLKEIIWIRFNKDYLLEKFNDAEKNIYNKISCLLPIYIQNIKQVLAAIDKNNKNVNLLNQELQKCNINETMPDYPSNEAINTIKNTIEKMKRNTVNANVDYDAILLTLKDIKDFSSLWETIKQFDELCEKDKKPKSGIQNNVTSVTEILQKCTSIKNVAKNHTFDAIKNLDDIFKKNNGSRIGPVQLKSFYNSRVDDLKTMLQYSQQIPLEENLHKYKNDKKFRFQLEMVLADLANIFAEITKDKVMNKTENLLRDIDLGNVLDHGNPFLDVIADVFDPYDLSNGLLSKAEMFAKHGDSMIQNVP